MRTWDVELKEDGIVHVSFAPGTVVSAVEAEATFGEFKNIAERLGRRPSIVIDLRPLKALTLEARRFYSTPEVGRSYHCMALVGGHYVANMIINVFLALRGPANPYKLFSDKESALTWLKAQDARASDSDIPGI